MLTLHRFLYGAIISFLIIWTIYLLTIDFYVIAFIPYQYRHAIHIPFPGNWLNIYFLLSANIATLLMVLCTAFATQFKNFKVMSTAVYNLDRTKEEIQA